MPKFTHDCDKCQFLGTEYGADLYICGSRVIPGMGPSVIARHGNEGSRYVSMPWGTIETALDQGPLPDDIMAAISIVEEIMVNTLKPRSKEFRPFLLAHGTDKVLAAISDHANRLLAEEFSSPDFPYDSTPFRALRAVALLRDGTVTFGLTTWKNP